MLTVDDADTATYIYDGDGLRVENMVAGSRGVMKKNLMVGAFAAGVLLQLAPGVLAAELEVGPDKEYKTVREAAQASQDGDVILVDSGVYINDVTSWNRDGITVRGVGGGRAHMKAEGADEGGKGIWVINGKNFTAENIEFSGASVDSENGAGIRGDGGGFLTVRNCYFHDNEDGILSSSGAHDHVTIENSIFEENGFGDGQSHNLYIGKVESLTFKHNYSHHAKIGHNLKSRAKENYILYNRIMDEADGTSSYAIDLPGGGLSFIIGNLIQQGPQTDNGSIIGYHAESSSNPLQELYVINNTIVNERPAGGMFLQLKPDTIAVIRNNVFWGPGKTWSDIPMLTESNNLIEKTLDYTVNSPGLVDPADYDYRLLESSPLIDGGMDPGTAHGFDMTPKFQYVPDANQMPRANVGVIDIGAYEFETAEDVIPPAAPKELILF